MTLPYMASIVERRSLAPPHATRKSYHLVLDLKGSGMRYQVGDSVGIYPENNEDEVEEMLKLVPGEDEVVQDRKGHREKWGVFLRKKANLNSINRKLVEVVAERNKSSFLKELLTGSDREAIKTYLTSFHLADFIEEHSIVFTPAELAPLLMPLLPRFYSVASSQEVVGDEVHLLVRDIQYEMRGKKRYGVASYQLCYKLPMGVPLVPVFHQPAHAFALTDDLSAPLIMIGPGTGVAPYRGFMQKRMKLESKGANWLFFGEWFESDHFFYREEWQKLVQENSLKLSTAFSRDQQHKIYVQHRMLEEADELFQWLEKGAYLYVCGDASKMAKDVEDALLEIIKTKGNRSEEAAHLYLKDLRAKKRYQRDVY
jgi:sulfite reductase (NADPH) flavoprotein alpha-component